MADLIQMRRDTAANWTSANPTLALGEMGLEIDTNLFKIGDGTTAWASRVYGGTQGIQGIQGETGAQGIQGEQGNDSTVPGPEGQAGPQGNQGIKGDAGNQGIQGIQGIVGASGTDGSDSTVAGPQGEVGAAGNDSTVAGPQGIQGIQGIQGTQGEAGTDSTVAGPQGIQGETGADGSATLSDDTVSEVKLNVSNAPINGYVLTAQSGDTGGLTWAEAPSGSGAAQLLPADSVNTVGSVISNSARASVYELGEWDTSGPWTFYLHSWDDPYSINQGFNMFMGDGVPNGTSQIMYVNDGVSAMSRVRQYAHSDRLGNMQQDQLNPDYTYNRLGVSWRCTPVRNTTDSSITRNLSVYLSSSDTNYGGCSIAVYTPNASTYSGTTAGTWTTPFTGGSNNAAVSYSGSIVVPANTTVLVFTNSSHFRTSRGINKDSNMLYGLDVFFDGDLLCDLRMLETIATARLLGSTVFVAVPYELYPICAAQQGDR